MEQACQLALHPYVQWLVMSIANADDYWWENKSDNGRYGTIAESNKNKLEVLISEPDW